MSVVDVINARGADVCAVYRFDYEVCSVWRMHIFEEFIL